MVFETSDGRPFDGVLFDLDGTLIDSVPDLTLALNALMDEQGLPRIHPNQVPSMVGQGARVLVCKALAESGAPVGEGTAEAARLDRLTERFTEHYNDKPMVGTRPYPGAEDLLRDLKAAGVRLGICTNKPQGPTEGVIRALGLEALFDAVVGAGPIPERKPHPAPVLLALQRMGVAPKRAAMVGDTPYDVGAAHGAGLPAVIVDYGYCPVPPAEAGADRLVSHLSEVPAALMDLAAARKQS